MQQDDLDRKVTGVFAGKVVRKDLLHQIKGGENVPSYVLEYLLGKYCASDNEDEKWCPVSVGGTRAYTCAP